MILAFVWTFCTRKTSNGEHHHQELQTVAQLFDFQKTSGMAVKTGMISN
jgi:hypothetical protein